MSSTIERLVRAGQGYRAKKIIGYSAKHYHDYRRVSCSTTISSARREIEECIKCKQHSWDTWHDRSRSVLDLTYRPELNIDPDHDHYPEELARRQWQHILKTGAVLQSPASFMGNRPGWYGLTEHRGLCYVCRVVEDRKIMKRKMQDDDSPTYHEQYPGLPLRTTTKGGVHPY